MIEDNDQDQKIIQRFLKRAGFENVVIADSGEKGIELAEEINPDIILLGPDQKYDKNIVLS